MITLITDNLEEEFGTWMTKQKESDAAERKAVTLKLQNELAALKKESDAKFETEKKKVTAEFVGFGWSAWAGVI